MTLSFWKYEYNVYADIRGGSWGKGASNDSGVVDDGNFQRLLWLFICKLHSIGQRYYTGYAVPRRHFSDPHMGDLE